MKKLYIFITIVFLSFISLAQSPEAMSYQAVIRDASNNLLQNTSVGIQVTILQGSVNGYASYKETHRVITNDNGLLSIEIGLGTTIDDFSNIEWADGPHFIKTDIDPFGGDEYTLTATSQLLSVPYALHAKYADAVKGGYINEESDPIFMQSIAAGISLQDTMNWNNPPSNIDTQIDSIGIAELGYAAGPHTVDTQIDSIGIAELGYVAGPHTVDTQIDSIGIAELGYVAGPHTVDTQIDSIGIAELGYVAGEQVTKYRLGDYAQGGIIFWLNETGQHGLVCSRSDQSAGVRWYGGTYGVNHAKGNYLFSGEANTIIIIASLFSIGDDGSTYAALISNEFSNPITAGGTRYGDWYLPSAYELGVMCSNRAIIDSSAALHGGDSFASDIYWSSTEIDSINATRVSFPGGANYNHAKFRESRVRSIRAF
jgi:hypothetical protein